MAKMKQCPKCGVELSLRELVLKYCFICYPPQELRSREYLPMNDEEIWNDAVSRNGDK